MKINTLRFLDLWVGRPICWLLTVLYFTKRFFVRKSRPSNPRKILFIKLFGAGSIVLAYPAIKATKNSFPESEIFFLTFHGNCQVVELTGVISTENIYTVRDDHLLHLLWDVLKNLHTLVFKNIDVAIDLEFFSRFTAILSFAIRSKYRIGFYGFYTEGLRRGRFINYPINYNHTLHTSKAFFSLLKPIGISQDDYVPTIPRIEPSGEYPENLLRLFTENSKLSSSNWTGRLIVINPNTSELISLRRWPEEKFRHLLSLLADDKQDDRYILIGSKAERPYVDQLLAGIQEKKLREKTINLAGKTSIRELLDLFHLANIFISNDSGPAHLAALTRVKTVTLFGPETPDLYAPLNENSKSIYLGLDCQPCITIYNGKHSYCADNQCLKKISASKVYEVASELMSA